MKIPVYTFPEMFNMSDTLLNFNINKIRCSDTIYKKDDKHHIDMYYKNNCIIIQLPRQKLYDIKDNIIKLELNNSRINEYIIQPLEEHICKVVHKYSEKWFNGKNFTMNKIINSLNSPFKKLQDESNKSILNLSFNKNTLFYNRYKTLIDINNIKKDEYNDNDDAIELITLISDLEFFENKFTYNFVLEQAKIFMQERLVEYSIIETPEDLTTNSESQNENEYYKESIDGSKQCFF